MKKLAMILAMVSMTSLMGCGFDFLLEPEINERAKAVLPGTWSDPSGNVSIIFDENCQIIGFDFPNLPAELAELRFDGTTFTLPIPGQELKVSATLMLEVATVDEAGNVKVEYRGELTGFMDIFDPGYVKIILTGKLDDPSAPTSFSGSIAGYAYPSEFLQNLIGLAPEISIADAAHFDADKS